MSSTAAHARPTSPRPPTTPSTPPPPSTPTTPSTRARLRSWRLPAAIVAAVLALAALTALFASSGVGTLDIDSYSDEGSHAVATVLRDQSVPVRQVRLLDEAAATRGGTLVVVGADLLDQASVERLTASGASTIVVVGATSTDVAGAFVAGAEVPRAVDTGVIDPSCTLPAAVAAGRADAGGVAYALTGPDSGPTTTGVTGCYPTGGEPSLLDVRTDGRRVVLVGNAAPLQNERFGREGNAALALNLLGADGDVTWYLPSLADLYGPDADSDGKSALDLVPDGVVGALAWGAVVVVLFALWRARRLGPVVAETLPVVVRASETDEGRARLYRRGSNRDRAAALLRAATRDRLAPLLGLPASTDRDALVRAVADRTARPAAEVDALLYGAAPHDDARLVQLADELDRLDREVHGP